MTTLPLFSDVAPKLDPLAQALAAEDRAAKRLAQLRRVLAATEKKLYDAELSITRAALRGSMFSEGPQIIVLRAQAEYLQQQVRGALADAKWAEVQRRRIE